MSFSPNPPPRRSFSLPVTRNTPDPDPQLDILFSLNSARIVSFTASVPPSRSVSSSGKSSIDDDFGRLSWVSHLESTIAVGPLRIYRAPGSVAFLNCANALRPILPKSQAWCVDGDGKFVLQVRRPQYWRIEVSNKTEEERAKVHELKRVLEQVLLFEKTPCPFQRDFVVELPEAPTSPVLKRPWKPVQGPSPSPVTPGEIVTGHGYGIASFGKRTSSASPLRQSFLSSQRRSSALDLGSQAIQPDLVQPDFESPGPSKIPSPSPYEPAVSIPEANELAILPRLEIETNPTSSSPVIEEFYGEKEDARTQDLELPTVQLISADPAHDDNENLSDATNDSNLTLQTRGRSQRIFDPDAFAPEIVETPEAIRPCSRSTAAPPVLSLITSTTTKAKCVSPLQSSVFSDINSSLSSSSESFHTVQSWHSLSPTDSEPSSPRQPLPQVQDDPKISHHVLEVSGLTMAPDSAQFWDLNAASATVNERASSPDPKTPTLTNDGSDRDDEHEIFTPPTMKQGLRHRTTTSSNSRRRQLSPLPAAVNLFSPTRRRPRHLQTARHLPTAIIQKTCEILLSPPSHLFHLMLNIASKIAAGEWRGVLLGHGDAVHWDLEDEYTTPGCFEDDYGIGLAKPNSRDSKLPNNSNWEID